MVDFFAVEPTLRCDDDVMHVHVPSMFRAESCHLYTSQLFLCLEKMFFLLQEQREERFCSSNSACCGAVPHLLPLCSWILLRSLPCHGEPDNLRRHLPVSSAAARPVFLVASPLFPCFHRVFAAVVFTALSIGRASSFAPDASKAQVSAAKIISLLNRRPQIDSSSGEGIKL